MTRGIIYSMNVQSPEIPVTSTRLVVVNNTLKRAVTDGETGQTTYYDVPSTNDGNGKVTISGIHSSDDGNGKVTLTT
jgi:hypothetical protein